MKISLRYDKEKAIQEPIVKVRCGPQKTVSKHLKHENYWNHQNKETPPPQKKKAAQPVEIKTSCSFPKAGLTHSSYNLQLLAQ